MERRETETFERADVRDLLDRGPLFLAALISLKSSCYPYGL